MARTRLRMMLTFPSLPLKFRKAGFPRYGLKVGISDEAFPSSTKRFATCGLHPPFVHLAALALFPF